MEIAPQLYQDQRDLPKTSGVYLFLDSREYPLYIGKSVNLRTRVASYLRNDSGQEERIQRMVHEARSLRYVETETELMALLLEDSLIKKYLPVYNIRQKQFRDYRYLQLSVDAYPRLITLEDPGQIQTNIYGPFRDRFFIQRRLHLSLNCHNETIARLLFAAFRFSRGGGLTVAGSWIC